MRESRTERATVASFNEGTAVPPRSRKSKFGLVAALLWPTKTVAELAFRGGVSERAAKYWLSGQRRPSTRILTEVLRELDQ